MRISFQCVVIGLAVMGMGSCRSSTPPAAGGPEQKAGVATAPAEKPKQKVFPWSVVSGGVDSPTAMRAAMQEDPVVEAHYAGLNPSFFRAEALPAKRQGYVSYRIRDKIYWTRKMVTLQAGETVLSDGQFLVRGRCGNLISATPREPVAPAAMEPEEPAMDQPVPGAQLMYSPPLPPDRVIETGGLQNPKQLGTDKEMTAVLPPPGSQEMLPPVWTTGGHSGGGGFSGIIGNTGSGGTTNTPPTSPSPPGTPTPETPAPVTPEPPVWTQTPPIEIAPPLVIATLLPPPQTPTSPTNPIIPGYIWEPPGTPVYPPLPPYSPHPPQITYPPTNIPPPSTPPPGTPPPGTPPPGTPPPGTPPPSGPPPADPPRFDPPPDSPPEEAPIPEPGPWILFALGLAGLAVGTVRRKY